MSVLLGAALGTGCFSDSGRGTTDAITGVIAASTDAGTTSMATTHASTSTGSSTGADATGSTGATAGATGTTALDTDAGTTGSSLTGTSSGGDVPCVAVDACGPDEFCDFADLLCGAGLGGVCRPRPMDCVPAGVVYGCDCEIYASLCHANQDGVDALGPIIEC